MKDSNVCNYVKSLTGCSFLIWNNLGFKIAGAKNLRKTNPLTDV